MKIWQAILTTIGLFVVCALITPLIDFQILWVMILATSIWAAIDSTKIKLIRYKSSLSAPPIVIFLGNMLFWVIVFPWYLAVRGKIIDGTAVLKPEFAERPAQTDWTQPPPPSA